jgi:hypothetical protein
MATRIIPAITEIVDDFTGQLLKDEDKPAKVTFTMQTGSGKPITVTMDLAEGTRSILRRFLSEVDDENRRALGDIIPRHPLNRSRDIERDSDGVAKRDWLRAHGWPEVEERGRFSEDQNSAWAAHIK